MQMFKIIIDNYFTSCLAIFVILIEIHLSIQRLLILKNTTLCIINQDYKIIIFILFLFSLIYYLPQLFIQNILSTRYISYNNNNNNHTNNSMNRVSYSLVNTNFGNSLSGNYIPISLTIIRIVLGTIVLTFINIINVIEIKKMFSNKIKYGIRNNNNTTNSKNRKINLMVIWTSVLYFVLMTPYNLSYILRKMINPSTPWLTWFNLISNFLLFLAHGCTFFIYYSFNNLFRKILILYFKKLFCMK
jgi:hypothetical protein